MNLIKIIDIILGSIILLEVLVLFTRNKNIKFKKGIIIFFASAIFLAYVPNLLSYDSILRVYEFGSNSFSSHAEMIWVQILRWMSIASFMIAILIPFSKSKNMGNLMVVFVLPVSILNLIFLGLNLRAMVGGDVTSVIDYSMDRSIFFILQNSLTIMFALYLLFGKTLRVEFKNYKKVLKNIVLTLPFILLISIPISTYQNFFGYVNINLDDFELEHRIALYFVLLLPLMLHLALHKKTYEEKYLVVLFVSFAAFIHFYAIYSWPFSWSDIPIHLCNAAMVIIPLSLVLKSKKIFYFTYFFNTIGGLLAMVMPNTSGDLFRTNNIHFWYEHISAFYIPVLVVALGVMPRPKFKEYKWALIVFVMYFLTALGLNAYVSNMNPNIDYFFLNSDFFISKFIWARPLRENYISVFHYKDLTFTLYPVYQGIIFIVFTLFTLILWTIYEYSYKVSDGLEDLFIKKKIDKLELREFIKEMDGKPLNEPINRGGVDMLKIKNLSKCYGNNKHKSLDNFSLEVNAGEVFGFLGHNGAGKSTTIKSMVGILPITEGSVEIFGYDIKKQPLEAKMQIGYVPDNHAVYERLTGREYVNYVADLYNVSLKDRKERLEKYLELFDLAHAIDNQIKTYSHGMKQKVTVIAALIHNPRLWVLDEPLTGLDPTSSFQVKESMRLHANEGNIVFFSSHVIDVVEKVCDRIAIIKKGKLMCVKDLKEMRKNGESLEKLYLKIVEEKDNV